MTGCSVCRTDYVGKRLISFDGTNVYTRYTHCSALNSTVEFYLERPGTKPILIGKGDDLDEFVQSYDGATHTITLMTPEPSDIEVRARSVGYYQIRKAALRRNVGGVFRDNSKGGVGSQ